MRFRERRRRFDRSLGALAIAGSVAAMLVATYLTWTRVDLLRDGVEITAQRNLEGDDFLEARYSYRVEDTTYDYVSPETPSTSTEPAAEVTLLVDPDHPERAAQRQYRDLFGTSLLALGIAVCLGVWGLLMRSRRGRFFGERWAEGRVIRDDLGTAADESPQPKPGPFL